MTGAVDIAELPSRQHEVLALLADGCSNCEIAARLSISVSAVEQHVSNIYVALGLWTVDKSVLRVRAALAYRQAVREG